MTIWQPGMRCVCVRAGQTNIWNMVEIEVGKVYTVESIDLSWDGTEPALRLREVIRISPDGSERTDHGFLASRFRPLSENRLDSLRALLNPTPARKKERAL